MAAFSGFPYMPSLQVKRFETTLSTFPSAASALAKAASAAAIFALISGFERSFCSLRIPIMFVQPSV
jgi:hypothetical protein